MNSPDLKSLEEQSCEPSLGYCLTNSCVMDFAQNYGYYVIWIDCGTSVYRFEESGCIGPSWYDYCESPIFEVEN